MAARRAAQSLALALLAGCGVAGRPVAPGPSPPAAPVMASPVMTPDGIELRVDGSLLDVDGRAIEPSEAELWIYATDDCRGAPIARGALGGVAVPRAQLDRPLRPVAVRGGRVGAPGDPLALTWRAPPPPPEAPLVFVDGEGRVQLSWLPPDPPIEAVEIRRGGEAMARLPADAALWTDRPPPGPHAYRLVGLAPGARTAASPPAEVEVPPP